MSDVDVTYADVKFTRRTPRDVSSPADITYSEVKIPPKQPDVEASNGRSKVTSERAALLALCVFLAAALVALGVTVFYKVQINQSVQTLEKENLNLTKKSEDLKAENKVLRKNISETKRCSSDQTSSPSPPLQIMNDLSVTCEAGWELYRRKFYYFNTNKSSWTESKRICKDLGGDLVKIDSREEQEFLVRKVKEKMEKDEDKFWIGLTDSAVEGSWLWVDGSPLDRRLTFWSKDEPDDWKGDNTSGEDCVRMGERGAEDTELKCWFDKSCDASLKSICEKSTEPGTTYDCRVRLIPESI